MQHTTAVLGTRVQPVAGHLLSLQLVASAVRCAAVAPHQVDLPPDP